MIRTLRRPPNLQRLELAVVIEIYDHLNSETTSFVRQKIIYDRLDENDNQLISKFINASNNNKLFYRDSDGDFYLTDKGTKFIIHKIESESTNVIEYLRDGAAWIKGRSDPLKGSVEARWSPLPIDRDTAEYSAMVQASEQALGEIEASNGYAHEAPDERDSIVVAIRGTLGSIKNSHPTRNLVIEGLVQPLRFIASKFSGAAIGEVAKVAVAAVLKWLASV